MIEYRHIISWIDNRVKSNHDNMSRYYAKHGEKRGIRFSAPLASRAHTIVTSQSIRGSRFKLSKMHLPKALLKPSSQSTGPSLSLIISCFNYAYTSLLLCVTPLSPPRSSRRCGILPSNLRYFGVPLFYGLDSSVGLSSRQIVGRLGRRMDYTPLLLLTLCWHTFPQSCKYGRLSTGRNREKWEGVHLMTRLAVPPANGQHGAQRPSRPNEVLQFPI